MKKNSLLISESVHGVIYSVLAFLIWGLSPLYWKLLSGISAFEVIMYRVIWSFLFLFLLLVFVRKIDKIWQIITDLKLFFILLLTSAIIASNWFTFITAVNNNMILEASLGYYMNPLINVILGMIFLKERLRFLQIIAVFIAGISVFYLTTQYGQFPWFAIYLALSFGFYGLIHKVLPVGALEGLFIETMILSILAVIYLLYFNRQSCEVFFYLGSRTGFLLIFAAFVTALPLLLFTAGAKRLHFSTIGFIQYIAPSCGFLLAIFVYNEPLYKPQLFSFLLIWLALVIYSIDSISSYRSS